MLGAARVYLFPPQWSSDLVPASLLGEGGILFSWFLNPVLAPPSGEGRSFFHPSPDPVPAPLLGESGTIPCGFPVAAVFMWVGPI